MYSHINRKIVIRCKMYGVMENNNNEALIERKSVDCMYVLYKSDIKRKME